MEQESVAPTFKVDLCVLNNLLVGGGDFPEQTLLTSSTVPPARCYTPSHSQRGHRAFLQVVVSTEEHEKTHVESRTLC